MKPRAEAQSGTLTSSLKKTKSMMGRLRAQMLFSRFSLRRRLWLSHINYAIANSSIGEDLDNCAVDLPLTNDFHQPELNGCGSLDFEQQQWEQDAWVIAEPGEFEESTNPELLNNFSPPPEKVARLKDDVAESIGLISSWTIPSNAEPIDLEDGTKKEFPEGSVVLQQKYNPEFPWPADSL
ncbi:hypothetical protein ACKLNR_004838 [Fusarium oxysporum f. sp. zingiberi]